MFSYPAQLEADTELRHLNIYCSYTCLKPNPIQASVWWITPLKISLHLAPLHHSNESDPSNLHPTPEISLDTDGFPYGQQFAKAAALARLRKVAAWLKGADTQNGWTCRWGDMRRVRAEELGAVRNRPIARDEAVPLSLSLQDSWGRLGVSWLQLGFGSAVWGSELLDEGRAACVPSFAW